MNSSKFNETFSNLYPVSKTLRFELKPVGRTLEYIERDGIIKDDQSKADAYPEVKKVIDRYHKAFIDSALEGLEIKGLEEYQDAYNKKDKDSLVKLVKLEDNMRKQIVNHIKQKDGFKVLYDKKKSNTKKFITKDIYNYINISEEEKNAISKFQKFTTYFVGFYENRKNMYSSEKKSTAIAYRIVNENLSLFIDNLKIYRKVKEAIGNEKINDVFADLQNKMQIENVESIFELNGFNRVLNQKGIDTFNIILGGYSEGEKKIRGLNETVNLYNQHNSDKLPFLKPLYKQILSDRESISFIPPAISDDKELLDLIDKMYEDISCVFDKDGENNILETFENIKNSKSGIFIANSNAISDLSNGLFSNWSVINDALNYAYEKELPIKKTDIEKYIEKRKKYFKTIEAFSVEHLEETVKTYIAEKQIDREWADNQIADYYKNLVTTYAENIHSAYGQYNDYFANTYKDNNKLVKSKEAKEKIKALLDSINDVIRLIKVFAKGQNFADKNEVFYSKLFKIENLLSPCTLLYNRVRNYVTQKPYSTEKIKLNFGEPTLLKGWSISMEKPNATVMFREENKYYLGIMNKSSKNKLNLYQEPIDKDDGIEKMCYLQAGDISSVYNLMVKDGETIKVNGRTETINGEKVNIKLEESKNKYLPNNINQIRINKSYKPNEKNFSKSDLNSFIDYYKDRVVEYFAPRTFVFKPTKEYNNFNEFTDHVKQQAYQIKFKNVSKKNIYNLVDEGKLYLFQIYNKDFSPYVKKDSTPNLHTMYWKALFDEKNLEDVIYELNGKAEVFFRKASISKGNTVCHHKGEKISKKRTPSEYSEFDYDIIKDKRYTVDKFQFHVPITMNFKASNKPNINIHTREYIKNTDDIYIIGIDRGERNLLYVSLIDKNGNIVKQKSLNEIVYKDKKQRVHKVDYHKLLDDREKENKKTRETWQEVTTIKELKEGYLSLVIHEIVEWIMEYNAIVVMEDLNFGFKQGRQKFEKQVYQKFEKMLIDKLNFVVDKKRGIDEWGGLFKPYQFTDKFESFRKMGKQTGILFYIPAWNTSKIDPTTGFVNMLYPKYESVDSTKKFIEKFDRIGYNANEKYFEFEFDYKNFGAVNGIKNRWTVCTYGERLENKRNPEKNNMFEVKEVNVTEELIELFEKECISWKENDLKDQIINRGNKDFYVKLLSLIKLTLQMRNSNAETGEDWLISPVKNDDGKFFDTREQKKTLPLDADANGAYHIAKKGLWVVEQIKQSDDLSKIKMAISNSEWLQYIQEHPLNG